MKLRNKKTGEVWNAWSFYDGNQTINLKYFNSDVIVTLKYNSLSELSEEWEDYKPIEPLKDEKVKKLLGEVVELELTINELNKRFDTFNKRYFELCGENKECV